MSIYHAIVFLPLFGFLTAGLFGRQIGDRASEVITTSLLFVSAGLSWVVFTGFLSGSIQASTIEVARWVVSGDLAINWAFQVDTLTAVMLVVVTTVSALVHLYSFGYMHDDPDRSRFFAYLSFFTFTMLMLVTADNLVQLFFGWEGVGVASYLLIGFWYKKPSACAAAMKAFIVNRVGDFGFLLGISLIFVVFNGVQFGQIFPHVQDHAGDYFRFLGIEWHALTLISLLLFMGAMGKSAQFLLHVWLPDAMEGPTPVSALIHAATMVTAGVFLVARMSPVFEYAPAALNVVIVIGGTTAFFAATVGLVQNDIKRVIAYSTCSQLGYMFVALGVGAYGAGIFHLFTHAFFKALLFLGAGSVIVAAHHEQDMRKMGGLWSYIPFTAVMMGVGTIALTGFPLTAGFYSKDAIVEAAYMSSSPVAFYGFWATVFAALMTSFYSWRLFFMTFLGKPRWSEGHGHGGHGSHEPHESPLTMLIPLGVLAIGALLAGFIFKDFFIDRFYEVFWKGSLFTSANNHILHDIHDAPFWVKASPFVMMVAGFSLALWMYVLDTKIPSLLVERFPKLYDFLLNKWYFDELYECIFVKPAKCIGRFFWKIIDGKVIDGCGPDGISARMVDLSRIVVRFQTGYVYHYAFVMLIGVAFFMTVYIFEGVR